MYRENTAQVRARHTMQHRWLELPARRLVEIARRTESLTLIRRLLAPFIACLARGRMPPAPNERLMPREKRG